MSEIESLNRRGSQLGRWKDRVKEYMSERGTGRVGELEQTKRECLDRERWRLFLGGSSLMKQTSETTHRYIDYLHPPSSYYSKFCLCLVTI